MQNNDENADKIQQLKQRIEAATVATQEKPDSSLQNNQLTASRIVVELVGGVLVGAGLGFYADRWLGTKPVFFLVLLFFGIAASIVNIYKLSAGSVDGEETPPPDGQ